MRRAFMTVCVAALAGGSALPVGAADKKGAEKATVQGELIDTYCYSAGEAKGPGHKDCAQKCAQSGIPVGVLVKDKAWTLATNPAPLAPYMADQIRVTGEPNQETGVMVPDKVEVQQQGGQWKEVKLSDAHHGGSEQGEFKQK